MLGDNLDAAAALQELSLVSVHMGDYDLAVTRMHESLALYQTVEPAVPDGRQLLSVAYANLGQVTLARGDADRAATHVEEALRRQRELGFSWALGDTLRIEGDIASERGDIQQALASYRECINLTRDHGDRRFLANALAGIAFVVAKQGLPERAARLYAANAVLRDQDRRGH